MKAAAEEVKSSYSGLYRYPLYSYSLDLENQPVKNAVFELTTLLIIEQPLFTARKLLLLKDGHFKWVGLPATPKEARK